MKTFLLLCLSLVCCCDLSAQNIEGQIIASQYGRWRVPGYAPNTYNSFAPDSCRVQGGASFFFAFNVGTPISIVDANPALTETVIPTAVVNSNVACAVTIAPVNNHQLPFYFTSATGGLQEALTANLSNPQANTVLLDNAFYQLTGGPGQVAAVIAAAQGNYNLGLEDITQVPTVWYRWSGTQYVKVGNGGVGTGLNTLVNDLVANNASNSGANDLYDFVATGSYSAQAAINAAAANGGTVILQPGVGRVPFTNTGNVRVTDNRSDIPATARGVTEFGAACDLRSVYGFLTAGSTAFSIGGGTLTTADIGRVIVAVGTVSGVPTVFTSAVAGITDSLHGNLTTAAPFSQATQHQLDLGHDDTAAITQGMNAVGGGGTLVFPAGGCLTHTQVLRGQSPVGLGASSQIIGFPGEDIFQAPDPSQGQGLSQGGAHIHDLTFLVDGRIDATLPWQSMNDSGVTTAHPALYRPIAHKTAIANNPLAPGWFQGAGPNLGGAYNGVATISNGSAVMCVPNAETAPAVAQVVVFPYLAQVYTGTVVSTAGSCAAGSTARTLSAALTASGAQIEWFAGASPQTLNTAIGGGNCPATITLTNSIKPAPGYESNVAAFGLVQIDGEQMSYFARSNAGNTTPANTLYNVQCAQNGTARAAHSVGATVVPLNNYQPAYPWPVTPTLNAGDTTPAGTAGFFPAWNVGNAAFAFPVATGISTQSGSNGAWSANARIENLSFYEFPNDINGAAWGSVNHTAMLYEVSPSYAATFANLYALYLFYGIAEGPPSIENANYASVQPTADGSHWDGITIYAANPVNIPLGNQNTFSNFNVYSQEATTTGAALGADTCFYFSALYNDQTGGYFDVLSLDHFKNLYCEPEGGPHATQMPQWEWDTLNSEIEDQHMGGGGEVAIGGAQQHWIGGNFNNAISTPTINYGYQNTADFVTNLGSEPRGNVYGVNTLINFDWGSRFSGTTSQSFSTATGPYGGLQVGGREPIPSQTNETFNTGNVTAPYTSSGGGLISPEEFNASFQFESTAMSVGWTFDDSSPVTHAWTGCNLGSNFSSTYCNTSLFNQQGIAIGPGQRLVPGKYTMYFSAKDAVTASNSTIIKLYSNCGSFLQAFSVPLTNHWPSTAASLFSAPVDFSSVTGAGTCYLGVQFFGAATADQLQVGYLDFAPVAETLNAQTVNATTVNSTTLNLPPGSTGGTATGCAQSPVTGINGGYTCPTRGWSSTLTANEGLSDTTVSLASTVGLSAAGCFFVDAEYQCYSGIAGSTLTGLTRGAYTTTAATHNAGAGAVSVNLVLGSVQQAPSDVLAYGGSETPILGVNNPTPYNHGGSSVLSINNGGNETWVDTSGAIHQLNGGVQNQFLGSVAVGQAFAFQPTITQSGYLLQTNGPNTAYQPLTLGGGHAGSLNVTTTPTIGMAAYLNGQSTGGASTTSYVCSGTDFDGNLIPGTTLSIPGGPATWSFPNGYTVICPWAAGVSTYQIYRTAGGGSQGLMGSGAGPGFSFNDFGSVAGGGTPPVSNGSNPHISVAGTGNPTITLGTAGPQIFAGTGTPTACGTSYPNGSLYINNTGAHASTNLLYVCNATTSTWLDIQ